MSDTPDVPKACQNCPSFLKKEEVSSFFRKSVGAPMCATYGHVIGKPGLKPAGEKAIGEALAESCPSYGNPKPATAPERPNLQVAIGDPEVITAGFPDETERAKVSSCLGCRNYVSDRAVAADLGWPAGMCAAQGRLILSHRTSLEARNCDWRNPGENRDSTDGIILKPMYEDAFGVGASPVVTLLKNIGQVIEPTTYESDREVQDDEQEMGIRAWRKINDPKGSGRFTWLPIFRTDFFEPTEQAKIPRTGDDEAPEHYVDHLGAVYKVAVLMQELDETPALWGQAGTGKTELFRHLAWLMHMPFDRISITESSEVDDLIGKFVAITDPETKMTVTKFIYGRIPKRWQKPGVLLLDEPNTGPDAVWQRVRPLTDNSKQMVLDENESEHIERHVSCYFGMAMNPAWDVRNIGARPLADADGNRLAHIQMTLPPEELEKAILRQRCLADDYEITDETLAKIMAIAKDIRQASDDDTLQISWGIRPQIKVARATKWFDPIECYQIAVTDSLEPEQAAFVLQVVRDHTPDPDA